MKYISIYDVMSTTEQYEYNERIYIGEFITCQLTYIFTSQTTLAIFQKAISEVDVINRHKEKRIYTIYWQFDIRLLSNISMFTRT